MGGFNEVQESFQTIRNAAHATLQVSTPEDRVKLQNAIDRILDVITQTHGEVEKVTTEYTQMALHYSVARMEMFERDRAAKIAAGPLFFLYLTLLKVALAQVLKLFFMSRMPNNEMKFPK